MDVYQHSVCACAAGERRQLANFFFEIGGLAVRFAKSQMFVHLQVHLDEEMTVKLMRGEVVNGQSASLGCGANGIEDVLASLRSRFHMHHDVRGNNLADAPLHLITDRVHLLETHRSRDADRYVHKVPIARSPDAHALGAQHAFELLHCSRHALLQSGRSCIQQSIGGAPAQPRRHPDHHRSHAQRGNRVGVTKPTHTGSLPHPGHRHTQDHHRRAPHVGGKMQRVCFQRLAYVLPSDACERSGPQQINSQRDAQDADREQAGPNRDLAKKQPLHSFPDDVGGGENEQARLQERREILDLAMTVGVVGIGRAVGNSNREIGNNRGDEIQRRMQGLGEHAETSRGRG